MSGFSEVVPNASPSIFGLCFKLISLFFVCVFLHIRIEAKKKRKKKRKEKEKKKKKETKSMFPVAHPKTAMRYVVCYLFLSIEKQQSVSQ